MTLKLARYVGQPCPYCGVIMEAPTHAGDKSRQASRDHAVVTKANGGRLNMANRVVCCRACNMEKGRRPIWAWWHDLQITNDPRAERVGAVWSTMRTE